MLHERNSTKQTKTTSQNILFYRSHHSSANRNASVKEEIGRRIGLQYYRQTDFKLRLRKGDHK